MALSIANIEFDEFRGYAHLSLRGLGRLVIFVGQNAVGKTNIVEGIQLLTAGESFRKPTSDRLVSWDADRCQISIDLVDEEAQRHIRHKMVIANGKKAYEVNGKRRNASSIRGVCPSVVFIPDHLQMVKASSAMRRDAVDEIGSQLSKGYAALRADYARALKQRNLLLKEEVHSGSLFESWDESLCVNGARLCVNRKRLFARIARRMEEVYGKLASGELLQCRYLFSWERFDESGRQRADLERFTDAQEHVEEETPEWAQAQLSKLSAHLAAQELSRKTSLVGPHKDEISFFINGRNARQYASQGQQRTIVLALKLAEVEVVHEMTGSVPILLLDDVMSELDGTRRDALTDFIKHGAQTFITTTNLGYFSEELLEGAQVVKLPIEGTKHVYR